MLNNRDDTPIRHIVSTIGSPSTELAVFLDNLLKPFAKGKYDVANSLEVVQHVKHIKMADTDILMSFDIIALFPSIPLSMARDIVEELWPQIVQSCNISKQLLLDIFDFVMTKSAVFVWNDQIIRQLDGCAMGSNTAPTMAALVTNKLLDAVIPKLPFKPKIIEKYVDDILTIIPKNGIEIMLKALNSFTDSIKFTYETEVNGKLPYLDILFTRQEDGSIEMDWYQKPTSSERVLHFLSNHHPQQKENVIYNMFYRALSICSSSTRGNNIDRIVKILKTNAYPDGLIKKQLNKALRGMNGDNVNPNDNAIIENEEKPIWKGISYINGLTETITRTLKSQENNFKFGFKPINQMRNNTFTKLKQKTEKMQRIYAVYKIPCKGGFKEEENINPITKKKEKCVKLAEKCNKCYIGQTKNVVSKRIRTHELSLNSLSSHVLHW